MIHPTKRVSMTYSCKACFDDPLLQYSVINTDSLMLFMKGHRFVLVLCSSATLAFRIRTELWEYLSICLNSCYTATNLLYSSKAPTQREQNLNFLTGTAPIIDCLFTVLPDLHLSRYLFISLFGDDEWRYCHNYPPIDWYIDRFWFIVRQSLVLIQ